MRAVTALDSIEAAVLKSGPEWPALSTTRAAKDARIVRAMGRAAVDYPRARVAREQAGLWTVRIFHTPLYSHLLSVLTTRAIDGFGTVGGTAPVTFTSQEAAMQHARREVHALKARRHPAGQPWLRGGDQ